MDHLEDQIFSSFAGGFKEKTDNLHTSFWLLELGFELDCFFSWEQLLPGVSVSYINHNNDNKSYLSNTGHQIQKECCDTQINLIIVYNTNPLPKLKN